MRATTLMKAADADIARSGLAGIPPHVAELEKALADGAADFPPKPGTDGKAIALTDGTAETLMAMIAYSNQKQAAVAIPSPYPEIGLMLAIQYNQVRQPQEALRVIDAVFKLKTVKDAFIGAHDAALLSEQAAAYVLLKRWSDALASQDAGLKAAQNDRDKARSQRGRGFALVELGQLNDAAGAYQESLKLEPGNAIAQRELAYIARLRAGGPAGAPQVIIPGAGQPAPPPPAQ